MKSVKFAVAAASAVAILVPAGAAQAAEYYEFRYRGAIATGVVYDETAAANAGVITLRNGGSLVSTTDVGSTNRFLRFHSGSCVTAPCPQATVQPRSSTTLVPGDSGRGTFAFGATLRLTQAPGTVGMNVVQRGFAAAGASQWKLQVDEGRPTCRFSDGTTVGTALPKGAALAVNTWYKLKCSRLSATTFELKVTGPSGAWTAYSASKTAGAILPTGNATIGAKTATNPNGTDATIDQFHGDLDELFFHRD